MGENDLLDSLKPELPGLLKPKLPKFITINTVFIVYLMIIIYTLGFSYYTIMKHLTFQTAAYDLGIFLNSFYNTLHEGRFLYTTLWEGSRFQNHYSPILFIILPIYSVFPRVETLLILQSFILAIGALPIYWIAKNEISKKAGLVFALLYLTYPALAGINKFDFHEVAFAPAFILFAFHYYRESKYIRSFSFIILALISREDVAMVVVPMAMLWLWELIKYNKPNYNKDKEEVIDSEGKGLDNNIDDETGGLIGRLINKGTIFCYIVIILGMAWFIITTLIMIPMYNPQGYWFVKEYSINFLLISLSKKAAFLVNLFLPLLFTSLLNKWILVASPIIARNLLSNRPTRFEINNQHQALLIPFVFISSIYFIKTANEHLSEQFKTLFSKKLAYFIISGILIINFFISPIPGEIMANSIIPQMVIVPDGGPNPISTGILPITPHDRALNTVINMIPKNASVYVQSNIFAHMADRPRVYYVSGDSQIFKGWNNPQIGLVVPWREAVDFDYILVDDENIKKSTLRNTDMETLDKIKQNYGVAYAIDGIYLFKKGFNGTDDPDPAILSNFDNHYLANYYNGIIIDYYNNNNLTGNPVITERVDNITFQWKKNPPIPGVINKDNFSAKIEGYLYAPQTGNYIFELFADDKARLYIDNQLVIDTWLAPVSPIEEYYNTNLGLGLHKVRIDYLEKVNNAYVSLYWYTPWKGLYEPIPGEYFYIPKTNVDNIYNGGNITTTSTIINNNSNDLTKMRNDNTTTLNITMPPTVLPTATNMNNIPLDK